eukprot:6301543-Pyramimonas_sp.AAC.1
MPRRLKSRCAVGGRAGRSWSKRGPSATLQEQLGMLLREPFTVQTGSSLTLLGDGQNPLL